MKLQLESQERKLDLLLATIQAQKDDEIKSHLARYFCIRISGYLENVIKRLINSYCQGSAPQPIANFLERETKNLTNLSDEKLLKFLNKFSDNWESKVSLKLTDEQRSSLNSIISNRNN